MYEDKPYTLSCWFWIFCCDEKSSSSFDVDNNYDHIPYLYLILGSRERERNAYIFLSNSIHRSYDLDSTDWSRVFQKNHHYLLERVAFCGVIGYRYTHPRITCCHGNLNYRNNISMCYLMPQFLKCGELRLAQFLIETWCNRIALRQSTIFTPQRGCLYLVGLQTQGTLIVKFLKSLKMSC